MVEVSLYIFGIVYPLGPSLCKKNCPAKSERKDIGAGYDTLGDNLSSFGSVGNQPLPIDINRLDEGDGISSMLKSNCAKWYVSCRLKCSASRISRIEHTSAATSDAPEGHPYMRRESTCRYVPIQDCKCFFCDEVGTETAPLHETMTRLITQRVKQCLPRTIHIM